jgi:hypothetical protein
MTLYLVGLGLGDEKDITVKGLEAVRASDKVFLEMYTAILGVDKGRLVRRFSHTHTPPPPLLPSHALQRRTLPSCTASSRSGRGQAAAHAHARARHVVSLCFEDPRVESAPTCLLSPASPRLAPTAS